MAANRDGSSGSVAPAAAPVGWQAQKSASTRTQIIESAIKCLVELGYARTTTAVIADKAGLFQAAHTGTLFLDEVADLPLEMQVKLLRAIQEKAVRAVGSEKETAVDVRILSATH